MPSIRANSFYYTCFIGTYHYRRCCHEPGSGRILPSHQVPVHHRLWHDGVCAVNQLREIRKWLEKYPVPERLAPEVTEIEMDGGSEIYTQLCPFWDGEDGAFDLNTITEAELRQFPNLKHITLMSSKPEQVLPVLERCGIKVDLL